MEHKEPVPDWLSLEFLNSCLHSKKKLEAAHVVSFTVEPAVPPGNNFGSCLRRVKLNYEEGSDKKHKTLSIILKSPLETGHLFFDDFYSSEPKFYNIFLPKVYKILNRNFTPKSFLSPIASVVVLEDLKALGYVMADRCNLLDFNHCCLYMDAAATFHAVSFTVNKHDPELIQSMSNEKMFSDDLESVRTTKIMIRYGLNYLADSILALGMDERFAKIIRDCSLTLWDMLVEVHKPNKDFNTLNQGDPWTANMMFRCDSSDDKLSKIKIFDFQNLRYVSPVNDLVFFIWSSANHHVRENRLEDLYKIYLDSLNSFLAEMNHSETFSYKSFEEHLKKLSPLALWTAGLCLPVMLNPSAVDLTQLHSKLEQEYNPEENPFRELYFEGYTQVHLSRLVSQLQLTGVFDYLDKINKSI